MRTRRKPAAPAAPADDADSAMPCTLWKDPPLTLSLGAAVPDAAKTRPVPACPAVSAPTSLPVKFSVPPPLAGRHSTSGPCACVIALVAIVFVPIRSVSRMLLSDALSPLSKKTLAATISIDMLISPASDMATTTSIRV